MTLAISQALFGSPFSCAMILFTCFAISENLRINGFEFELP